MSSQLAVGFDLDMTLIDTVPGFAAVLRVLGEELGVEFPVEELTSRLGPPLDQMLAPHLPADQVGPAGDRFRALYPEHAVPDIPVLPGAHEALAAVRRHRGRVVVVTGKYPPNAQRHIDHLGPGRRPGRGLGLGRGQGRGAPARGRRASTSATTCTTSRAPARPAC